MKCPLSDITFSSCFTNSVWLSKTHLKNIKYRIVIFKPELLNGKISKDPQMLEAFKPVRQLDVFITGPEEIFMLLFRNARLLQTFFSIFQLTFARFYLPAYIPEAEKAIYLDDDTIIQGKTPA